jgi:hypothetical protein
MRDSVPGRYFNSVQMPDPARKSKCSRHQECWLGDDFRKDGSSVIDLTPWSLSNDHYHYVSLSAMMIKKLVCLRGYIPKTTIPEIQHIIEDFKKLKMVVR